MKQCRIGIPANQIARPARKKLCIQNTVSYICLQKRDITKGILELHQLERYIYI